MALNAGAAALKPAQERVLAALRDDGREEVTRSEYEELGGVSRSQAAYDLADLVQSGLVERVGLGRSTRYRLAQARTGRTRKWTDERIRNELESFCSGREEWPGAAEFRRAGRGDLYLAASRYGGIDYWSREMGLREPVEVPVPNLARRLVLIGVVTAAVLAALAVGSVAGLGWQAVFDGGESSAPEPLRPRPASLDQAPAAETPATAGDAKASATPALARIALRARSGKSWLEVRRNSANGRVLYRGRLDAGDVRQFEGKRLWLRLGAPASLRARLNGRPLALPSRASTAILTAGGLTVFVPRESTGSPPAVPVSSTQTAPPPSSSSSAAATSSSSSGSPAPDAVAPSGPTPDPPPRR